MNEWLTFLLGLFGFALSHSMLADRTFKSRVLTLFPKFAPFYRISYNLVATVSLAVLYLLIPKSTPIYRVPFPWILLNVIVLFWAIWNAFIALKTLGTSTFLGINQLKNSANELDIDERNPTSLVTSGWFSHVRHPLYFFSIVILLANPIMTDVWIAITLFTIIYFFIGIIPEEKRLERLFGKTYSDYKSRTPAIFPTFWKRQK